MTHPTRPPASERSEGGFSLIEVMVAMLVTAITLSLALPVLHTFLGAATNVQASYAALDSVTPASDLVPQYLREAVSPAPPTAAKVPTPPLCAPGTNGAPALCASAPNQWNLWFFADTSNGTQQTNGPVLVNAALSGVGTGQFQMSIYAPDAGSCPTGGSTTTFCTYLKAKPQQVVLIPKVTNGSANPVFTYLSSGSTSTAPGSAPTCVAPATVSTCLAAVTGVLVTLQSQNSGGASATWQTQVNFVSTGYNRTLG